MSEENKDTAVTKQEKAAIGFGNKGVEISSLEGAYRFANYVVASGFAPKGMEKPEAVLIAVQLGAEIGLTPMAALQNIGVINGRPGIFGDAALALVRGSGLCEKYSQSVTGEGDSRTATVITKRKDGTEIVSTFSVADAKKAALWAKPGPWSQYPDRMLVFRARGFNLRDNFGDVLKGMRTTEELQDMPRDITAEVDVKPLVSLKDRIQKAEASPVAPATVEAVEVAAEPVPTPVDAKDGLLQDITALVQRVPASKIEAAYKDAGLVFADDPALEVQTVEVLAKLKGSLVAANNSRKK
jgi:hypothetical protein